MRTLEPLFAGQDALLDWLIQRDHEFSENCSRLTPARANVTGSIRSFSGAFRSTTMRLA